MATGSMWTGDSTCSYRWVLVGAHARIQSRSKLLIPRPLTGMARVLRMCTSLETSGFQAPPGRAWCRDGDDGPAKSMKDVLVVRRRRGAMMVDRILSRDFQARKRRTQQVARSGKRGAAEARAHVAKKAMRVDLIEAKKTAWRKGGGRRLQLPS